MAKKPWGGRFKRDTKGEVEAFTSSISFDTRLAKSDIKGSIAHVKTLGRGGVIKDDEVKRLCSELERIGDEIEEGSFLFDTALEDVHMNIEAELIKRLGDLGGRLHTARSRNDQVATDTRLFVKDEAERAIYELKALRRVFLKRAKENIDVIMPGYTHLQRAQPVLLSHHLLAYWEMFYRDAGRFKAAYDAADNMPLGSGALAGVPYPIDRNFTAKLLNFSGITRNSMDAVSDRDYILDYLFAASVTMLHLSRLSEELVIFSSAEFGFVGVPDDYATGSSIMPQKKNPDVPELVRGKSGRVIGDLLSVMTMLKGLPLTYMRDLQEDKEALFDAVDSVISSISVIRGLMQGVEFNGDRMAEALESGFITATDVADYLVKKGMSFRDAHSVVGGIVSELEAQGKGLYDLKIGEWQGFSNLFDDDIVGLVRVEESISSRNVPGGTAPGQVKKMIEELTKIEEKEA